MGQFNITTKPLGEVKKQGPSLPVATLSTELVERDGVQGIAVTTFYPIPDDEAIEVTERKGKNTLKKDADGKQTGVDNSDKVVSILKVIGRASKVDLIVSMTPEGATEPVEVALTDSEGNQIQHSSKLFIRVKGEGAEDEADEPED